MTEHLSHDIGWPAAIIALALFVVCLPALFAWCAWEIRRYGRVLRGARIIDADYRFDKVPAAASLPRRPAAGTFSAIREDPFARSTVRVLDAIDEASVEPSNVVQLDRWSVGA